MVKFPAVEVRSAATPMTTDDSSASTPPRRLLLVAPLPEDSATVAPLLETAGVVCTLTRVETVDRALAAREEERPDAVLLGFSLPFDEGLRAVRLLRERGDDVPIVVLSRTRGEHLAIAALKCGADDYILDYDVARLAPSVRQALADRERRDAARRAEAERRRSLETQVAMLDALPSHVALLDGDGRVVAVNESWRRFAAANGGLPGDDGVGRNYLEVCGRASGPGSDEARAAAEGIRAVLRGERASFTLEYPCHGPDEQRWFRLVATPLPADRGPGAVVTHLNITARRLAQEALRRSEERHRLLFESNPMPCWVYDLETLRFLAVNAAAVEKYGHTREEFLALTIKDIRPSEDVPALLANVRQVTDGLSHSGVWRHRLKDGRVIRVEIHSHALDFEGRRAELVIAHDVTARLAAEEEKAGAFERERQARRDAEAARRHYQSLFEYAPGSYLVLHPDDYRILAASEAYLRATLSRRADIQGRPLFEVLAELPADAADALLSLRASLERVKARRRTDVMPVQRLPVRRVADGVVRWEERYWSPVNTPVPGPDGAAAFLIHRLEDVTDYVRTKQAAGEWDDARPALDAGAQSIEADVLLRDLELKRTSEQLALSQALVRIASRAAQLGGWLLEPEPERLLWSDETCLLHDRPAGHQPTLAEAIGYFAPEHRAGVEAAVRRSLSEGVPFEFEATLVTAKGRRLWVRAIGDVVKDEHGAVRALQGAVQDITRQKEHEAERDALRLRDAALVSALGEIVYDWRPGEDQLIWEGRVREVLGYSPEEMGADTASWTSRVHPDDLAAVLAEVDRAAAERRNYTLEYRFRHRDGHYLWMRDSGAVFAGPDGGAARIVGVFTDISRRREEEERTRRLAERLRTTLESIAEGFFTLDRAWRFTYVNPAAEAILRAPAGPLVGKRLWSEFPATVGSKFEAYYRKAMEQRVPVSFVEYYPEPYNAWLEVRAYPSDEGLAVHFHDVTAQRRQQQALLESEERFRLLAKATTDAIWDWDLVRQSHWWNETFESLFGFTRAEIEPTREFWTSRVHPEDRGGVVAEIERAIATGAASWSGEYRFRRKDGSHALVLDRGHIVRDPAGKAVRMIGGMTDVTERRKLEQQFLRAQRMEGIGTLAGGIAHDLNNLLSPITMGVALLRLHQADPKAQSILDSIERSARRGADLVRQVLSFARGVEGTRSTIQVRQLVRELESIIGNTFPKNVQFETRVASDMWPVIGDPTQLNQVLLNLTVNARDAMPSGGRLTLSADNILIDQQYAVMNRGISPGRFVVLGVTDTGVGMTKDVLDRIFDPFFTTKEVGQGSGLGLPTVLGIVRSHGGFVNVYSEPGRGSTFKVYLPALDAAESSDAPAPGADRLPRGKGELVLVVDDEASILDITRQTLEAFGYAVVTAEDGAQAIGQYAQARDRIRLVLTDMSMPVMDGATFILALRRIDPHVPVIAASGLNSNGYVAKAAHLGIKHFLPKPYTADTLLTKIHEVLRAAEAGGAA